MRTDSLDSTCMMSHLVTVAQGCSAFCESFLQPAASLRRSAKALDPCPSL